MPRLKFDIRTKRFSFHRHRRTYGEEFRVEVGKARAVRLRDRLQHASDVLHVVQVDDGVVDRADHLHRVIFQYLALAQLRNRFAVLQLREHRLYVAVSLEQSAAEPHTRSPTECMVISPVAGRHLQLRGDPKKLTLAELPFFVQSAITNKDSWSDWFENVFLLETVNWFLGLTF